MVEGMNTILDENTVFHNPIDQFRMWFEEAGRTGVPFVNAMTLATCTRDGRPSARIVLLKEFDDRGFAFFTNYNSRKGRELSANPYAALVFHWPASERQIRVEGTVGQVTREESDIYFRSRPRESQISAVVSAQSEAVPGRRILEDQWKRISEQPRDIPVPRPEHWGGYRLRPERIEFWQSRESRLHDRILYTEDRSGGWSIRRLAP